MVTTGFLIKNGEINGDAPIRSILDIEMTISYGYFVLAGFVTLFLSFFERFEHTLTAILFGLSTPGFVVALSELFSF